MEFIFKVFGGLLAGVVILLNLQSCSTPKKVTYLQGAESGQRYEGAIRSKMTVRPHDRLSIVVSSKDPSLAEVFNKAVARHQVGGLSEGTTATNGAGAFTVDSTGEIDYPLLGKVKIVGLDRHEAAARIGERLIESGMLKDPVVTVEFLNATVSVLGDVAQPGEYPVERDDITLLQVLAKAGDLQITGRRDNLLVIRRRGNEDVAYRVDLTNADSLFRSPVYVMQGGDVVYVEPNDTRKRQSTANGNNLINPSFWLSVVSVITTVCVLIFK